MGKLFTTDDGEYGPYMVVAAENYDEIREIFQRRADNLEKKVKKDESIFADIEENVSEYDSSLVPYNHNALLDKHKSLYDNLFMALTKAGKKVVDALGKDDPMESVRVYENLPDDKKKPFTELRQEIQDFFGLMMDYVYAKDDLDDDIKTLKYYRDIVENPSWYFHEVDGDVWFGS